uniref:Pinin/SDK domain-containing protein n=1 Tax=Sarcophilus harrisii TaxID=9305 RepID=A0A7N4P7L3_SARHA
MAVTVRTLQEQLEKAKESLKNVDKNIRKLTGQDPNDVRPIQARLLALSGPDGSRGCGSLLLRRGFSDSGGGPPAKQRDLEGAVSRLGGERRTRKESRQESDAEDDDVKKPALQGALWEEAHKPSRRGKRDLLHLPSWCWLRLKKAEAEAKDKPARALRTKERDRLLKKLTGLYWRQ